MSAKPWKLLKEEVVFEKYGRKVVKRDYRMPDGESADFYVKVEKDVCCILALTADKNVILVEQYRPGPDKVLLELPGGFIEKNKPLEAISTELKEETGYEGNIELVGECLSEGYTKRNKYVYVATDCRRVSDQKLEDTEFLEVKLMSLEDFRKHLKSGQLTDVEVGYLALDYLGML